MSVVLYLDTSVVLRAVLERGASPELEQRIGEARVLITSRLALLEAARALLRLRHDAALREEALADAAREIDSIWARCAIWELTAPVCELATQIAPQKPLRTLDALHLATYLLVRRHLGSDVAMLTADRRLEEEAAAAE
jgi:predicted nucleic acid-binding protein